MDEENKVEKQVEEKNQRDPSDHTVFIGSKPFNGC